MVIKRQEPRRVEPYRVGRLRAMCVWRATFRLQLIAKVPYKATGEVKRGRGYRAGARGELMVEIGEDAPMSLSDLIATTNSHALGRKIIAHHLILGRRTRSHEGESRCAMGCVAAIEP